MRRSFILGPAWAGLLGSCAHKAETVDRDKAIAAIQKAEEAQGAALARRDLDAAVAVFAKDGTLYLPDMPPIVGREAIRAINGRALNDPALNVTIDKASRKWWVSASGDLATTTYRYSWTHTDAGGGKPVTQQVVSQTTWVRQVDGSWKNVSDLNAVYPNSGRPGA